MPTQNIVTISSNSSSSSSCNINQLIFIYNPLLSQFLLELFSANTDMYNEFI